MPKLEHAKWVLDDAEYDWRCYYSIDKKYRDELVQSVQTMRLPSSAKKFSCSLKTPYYRSYGQILPKFIEEGAHDPVSCAMRELTRHCTEISLEGPFHLSLFDPPRAGPAVEDQPCWQQTTGLEVKIMPCNPEGSWLFWPQTPVAQIDLPEGLIDCTRLPPGYANTEEEREEAENYYDDHEEIIMPPFVFESTRLTFVPDDEKFNAMIAAFARCCARMSALQLATLLFNLKDYRPTPFYVILVAPFRHHYLDAKMLNALDSCRIYLHAYEWRPTNATITELKNVGLERNGQPSTICFLPCRDYSG